MNAGLACILLGALSTGTAHGATAPAEPAVAESLAADARIRRVTYADDAVVTVRTRRGQVTHIAFAPDELLVGEPATGQGSDCRSEAASWCVIAADTGRDLYVKPKEGARPNTVVVLTTRRRHVFELHPVDKGPAALRVELVAPAPPRPPERTSKPALAAPPTVIPPPWTPDQLVAHRLQALPQVRNAAYTVAEGRASSHIVPLSAWDDGRSTYLTFAGRALPAIFEPRDDGTEEMVNVRMNEQGQLVADRVAPRLLLRLDQAVALLVNDAYDDAPSQAAPDGVVRVLRAAQPTPAGTHPRVPSVGSRQP